MSALRRKKTQRKKTKPLLLVLITVILAVWVWLLFKKALWNGRDKINLVINSASNSSVYLLSVDPQFGGMFLIAIPDSVEVVLTRNLGEMRLKNVWQLGSNEKLGGKLLVEVITKNFQVPASVWADEAALGFWRGGLGSVIKAGLSRYQTNLTVADKFRLAIFSLRVKDFKKSEIDLAATSYLTEQKLLDGESGFVISGLMPQKVMAICSDSRLTKTPLKVEILDAGGREGVAREVGEIIESMGAKIALIRKLPEEDLDCVVYSKDESVSEAVKPVFGCAQSDETPEGNFDLVVKLGRAYAKRF